MSYSEKQYVWPMTATDVVNNACESAACMFLRSIQSAILFLQSQKHEPTCAHNPVAILTYSNALAGLFKFKVL